jgi:pimeloyl-ACP methyl ester carboxylesterase
MPSANARDENAYDEGRARPRVLLVHGIWNAKIWMLPFARLMHGHGYAPALFGYQSVFGSPEDAADALIARLRREPVDFLIGHSLGGLIALSALDRAPDLPIRRAVCLGSPLRGSTAARALIDRGALRWVLGHSSELLRAGFSSWDGVAEIGAIAGDRPRGLGGLFAGFQEPSDGTVSVAETRLPGLADHCVVSSSHSGLALSSAAARQAAAFLREGRFERDFERG